MATEARRRGLPCASAAAKPWAD